MLTKQQKRLYREREREREGGGGGGEGGLWSYFFPYLRLLYLLPLNPLTMITLAVPKTTGIKTLTDYIYYAVMDTTLSKTVYLAYINLPPLWSDIFVIAAVPLILPFVRGFKGRR